MNGWELMIASLVGVAIGVVLTLVIIYCTAEDEK